MVDGTRASGTRGGSTNGRGGRARPGTGSAGRVEGAVDRGFLGTIDPMVIQADDGRVVWEMDSLAFLAADGSANVDDSLWRQSALTARHGLYEVTTGIYQVRGFDLSNLTIVEGATGIIVIDPLISAETAAAALALYRRHRGDRPVTGLIYTHAHVDHFGGVLGVVEPDTAIPVVAPEHFLDNAVSENVYAGTAMFRRATTTTVIRWPAAPPAGWASGSARAPPPAPSG